jgi:hypothetical protein
MVMVKGRAQVSVGLVYPRTNNSPQRRTTAWMQEVEQRREQLPKGRRENINENHKTLCVLCVSAVKNGVY